MLTREFLADPLASAIWVDTCGVASAFAETRIIAVLFPDDVPDDSCL